MKPRYFKKLTKQRRANHNYLVTEQSVTRISLRQETKEHTRSQRFFCVAIQHPAFMAGLLGLPTGRPVSFVAGKANPDNLATNSSISLLTGGSKTKELS